MASTTSVPRFKKPDYGIDAPGVVRNLTLAGAGLLLLGLLVPQFTIRSAHIQLRTTAYIWGAICLVEALAMLLYSKVGKFRHCDRMLAKISWRGDERVLDVGTGRGVLMIGAAKRLKSNKAVGIDVWSKDDLGGNSMEATLRNAELEGVRDRIEVLTEDATKMSFPDDTFDVVLSNLCIHNIPTEAARDAALREVVRVLKPEGKAVISDFKNTARYAKVFREAGLQTERSGMYVLDTFPPLRIIVARKG